MSRVSGSIGLFAAAICSAAFVAPAAAAMFTIESTFTATPNVVEVGEKVDLHLTLTLLPTVEGYEAGIFLFGTATPDNNLKITDGTVHPLFMTVTNGPHAFEISTLTGFNLTPSLPAQFGFSISYATPGTYFPEFVLQTSISARKGDDPTILHLGGFTFGSTVVSAVPGPLMGTGIPSIALAFASVMFWRRRVSRGRGATPASG